MKLDARRNNIQDFPTGRPITHGNVPVAQPVRAQPVAYPGASVHLDQAPPAYQDQLDAPTPEFEIGGPTPMAPVFSTKDPEILNPE